MCMITSSDQTLYKGFGPNLTCRDTTYSVGVMKSLLGPIRAGHRGLHCCRHLVQVFEFYPMAPGNSYAIVTIPMGSEIDETLAFVATNQMRVERILSIEELEQMSTGVLVNQLYWSPRWDIKLYGDHRYEWYYRGTMVRTLQPPKQPRCCRIGHRYFSGGGIMERACIFETETNDTGTLSTQMEVLFLQSSETETLADDATLSSFQSALLSVRRHLKSYVYTTPNMLATLLMISIPVQTTDNLGPREVRTHSHVFLQDTQDTTLFRCRSCYTTIQISSREQGGLTDLTWVRSRP